MCSSPEGYGSISRTYVESGAPTPAASGFGTEKASSAAQNACHLASIASGSYLSGSSIGFLDRSFRTKKPLETRGSGGVGAASPRFLPGLREQKLHGNHCNRHDRRVPAASL